MIGAPTHRGTDGAWTTSAIAALERVGATAGADTARDEMLGRHTSMGVGGPTPLMLWPRRPAAVATIVEWCAARGLAWRPLGGGTNVLVADAGVTMPIVNLTRLTDGADVGAPEARFAAGTPTARALRETIGAGLRGMVWSSGLPGTLGGAAAGNAGCWGGEMADVVTRLEVVDRHGAWHTLRSDELDWRYRSNPLPGHLGRGAIIVSMNLSVQTDDAQALRARSDELQRRKQRHQPIGARNAGCIFKNPDADHAAGRLIDEAGCKGLRVGAAQISATHGNFLLNHGGAHAADVAALIEQVKRAVRERFGLALQEEIHRW